MPWLVRSQRSGQANTPAAPEHAVDLIAEWFRSPSVTPLNPGTQHIAIFRNMLAAADVGGDLVTDAHIAALAIEPTWESSSLASAKTRTCETGSRCFQTRLRPAETNPPSPH